MKLRFILLTFILLLITPVISAANGSMPAIAGIRLEFVLFALTLIGLAVFHHKTMIVALIGLTAILLAKYVFTDFIIVEHIMGLHPHAPHKNQPQTEAVSVK